MLAGGATASAPLSVESASPGFWRGTWIALLVGILTWLNPLVLFNAHAWPQWDIWPMPFFLFAVYFALRRWWLAAGLLIGFGPVFKGQILMVGWALMSLFTAGFCTGINPELYK